MRLAHQMAMYSPKVTAEMVDANEFDQLSSKYRVMGVPKTVINDGAKSIEGAVPEPHFLKAIQDVLDPH